MDLVKLSQTQQILRDRINYTNPDRFNKTVLALLVEMGECAQEYRKFKFWSKDQEPRREKTVACPKCAGSGKQFHDDREVTEKCYACEGAGEVKKFPLLEEYVDGLHFVLELGIDINYTRFDLVDVPEVKDDAIEVFTEVFEAVTEFKRTKNPSHFRILMETYLLLGKTIGYTPAEIEKAYFDKNEVNHVRQDTGY